MMTVTVTPISSAMAVIALIVQLVNYDDGHRHKKDEYHVFVNVPESKHVDFRC